MASHPRAYQLPSGEHVLILPSEPLPQPVVGAVNARAGELKAEAESDPRAISASLAAALRLKEQQEAKIGRTIIAVTYGEEAIGEKWGTAPPVGKAFHTEAEAVANAEAFIAAAPHYYLILVIR